MPLQATSGAASYDAFGGGVAAVPNYIEEVFSTWLYNGTDATQTITNGIDLAGKGGLVWAKKRSQLDNHVLLDTSRGLFSRIFSNTTGAAVTSTKQLDSFNADGFTIASTGAAINESGQTYVSWTFREQPKFFDVVTYTGNNAANRAISHNLGSVPGCIIVKATSSTGNWRVWHRSTGTNNYLSLNLTSGQTFSATGWGGTNTETQFYVSDDFGVNADGTTYVAYLFAHNAGGFGLTGTDNVISCGSFTINNTTVNLGWEPQWLLVKRADSTGNWIVMDNMRGLFADGGQAASALYPNLSNAEATNAQNYFVTSTGFYVQGNVGGNWIYIAIRRGPMKVPTTGTSVFAPVTQASFNPYSVGFPTDLAMGAIRGGNALNTEFGDRLRGGTQYLVSSSTAAEANDPGGLFYFDLQNSMDQGLSSSSSVFWNFRRAPGFFDEVCATTDGNGVYTGAHNLGVAPELIITKPRNAVDSWWVYSSSLGVNSYILLNSTAAAVSSSGVWGPAPTSSIFTMINGVGVATQVAYLFASCPGVSKVGSYTGTGTTQVINCGFTAGARFVLIKATSTTGNWLVWDSARGIVAGNDPYLALNSTAAEVTNTDWVDTAATGFELSNAGGNLANSNGVSYVFLAIS